MLINMCDPTAPFNVLTQLKLASVNCGDPEPQGKGAAANPVRILPLHNRQPALVFRAAAVFSRFSVRNVRL